MTSEKKESPATAPNVLRAEPIPDDAWPEVQRLLSSGDLFRYTCEDDSPVTGLEREFADTIGAKYALAVSSCSAALFLALKALDLPQNAKILVPAFTFAAVPSAIVHANCVPVLVEVGDDYRVDLNDFQSKFTEDIHAVLISHMRGHTSDMDAIMALADARNVPVIEDAAHSLGTLWNGKNIGTIGAAGCFSFQSYKMMNSGEGGMLISDDANLIARAVIMSGAYEQNWQKHQSLNDNFARWQNQLPLYNMRMSNLAAAVVRPQLTQLPRRVADGRANHGYVADILNKCPWFSVPGPLPGEQRAPDSIQFNLIGMSDRNATEFVTAASKDGISVQIFGLSQNNARAFWNWRFLPDGPDLPITRAMLMRACDVRLPARLNTGDLDYIADGLVRCAGDIMRAHSG